ENVTPPTSAYFEIEGCPNFLDPAAELPDLLLVGGLGGGRLAAASALWNKDLSLVRAGAIVYVGHVSSSVLARREPGFLLCVGLLLWWVIEVGATMADHQGARRAILLGDGSLRSRGWWIQRPPEQQANRFISAGNFRLPPAPILEQREDRPLEREPDGSSILVHL